MAILTLRNTTPPFKVYVVNYTKVLTRGNPLREIPLLYNRIFWSKSRAEVFRKRVNGYIVTYLRESE